jgi:hypothetical protein
VSDRWDTFWDWFWVAFYLVICPVLAIFVFGQ